MPITELKGLKKLQGLDVLLEAQALSPPGTIIDLALNVLRPGKFQPRTTIDEEQLQGLAASIRAQGIILPLIVRRVAVDHYEIIAGERRWRAAAIAGLTVVPAIVRDVSDEIALAFALIENIQRESLSAMDEALACLRLKHDFSMTHEEIAQRIGRSRSSVTNLMRLLGLTDEVKEWLRTKKLEMGHARALLSLPASEQAALAKKIIAEGLSVRDTEKLSKKNTNRPSPKGPGPFDDIVARWERSFSGLLSSKVKIDLQQDGTGRMMIYINSLEEVEWLLTTLKMGKNVG